ncbi:hypothetical protein ACS0TY_027136 [Phlomoides rotata]
MIVRDEAGSFITSLTKLHQGLMTVDEWEVCGVVEVIKWMRELGFSHVIIEVDAKRVFEALKSAVSHTFTIFGNFVEEGRSLLRDNPYFELSLVGKFASHYNLDQHFASYYN